MRKKRVILLISLAAFCAQGSTLTVDLNGTGDYPTIQAAINDANEGDIVELQPGTYTGYGNRDIDFLGKAITVRGSTGDPNDVIIDCQGTQADPHRGFNFISGEDANSILENLTITNGYGSKGNVDPYNNTICGAILCKESCPCIRRCIVSNNNGGGFGGGFYNYDSNPTIINCTIKNNTAVGGGGIYNIKDSNVSMVSCLICDNSAVYGGGIYNLDESKISIDGCTFVGNSADDYGGAILNPPNSNCKTTIKNSIIWNNSGSQLYGYNTDYFITFSNWQYLPSENRHIPFDPLFADDGYHLMGTSPCIDAGDPNYVAGPNDVDLDGDPRVVGKVDMGTDEVYSSTSPLIVTIPGTLLFQTEGLSSDLQTENLTIGNYGSGLLNWQIQFINDCNWLSMSHVSGQLNTGQINDIEITANPNNVRYGLYSCKVQVFDPNAENSPLLMMICLEVLGPVIGVDKINVYFTAYGKTDDDVADRQLIITNTGYDTLNWHIEIPNDCNWLSAAPKSGQVTDGNSIVTLSVDPNKAPNYGYNYCTLQIIDPNASNSPQSVEVRLKIYGPAIDIDPLTLNIYSVKDTINEAAFTVTNSGYDILDWIIEIPNDCNWLKSVNPLNGACSRNESVEVTVVVDSNGLDMNEVYQAQLKINSPQLSLYRFCYIYLRIYEPDYIYIPYDYPTLQQAVDAARLYGDTIIIHPGKYAGCDIKDKAIAIRSTEPNNPNIVAATIIGSSINAGSPMAGSAIDDYIKIKGLSLIYDNQMYPGDYSLSGIASSCQYTLIENCIIKNWPVGGITVFTYSTPVSIVLIENCLICENVGVGISSDYGETATRQMKVSNCTITATKPDQEGHRYAIRSGIKGPYSVVGSLFLTNSIIKNAVLPSDIEIYFGNSPSVVQDLSISNSCIPAGRYSIYRKEPDYVNLIYGPGNIETDPCFAMPGYINDNNTPADTKDDFCIEGDYHLKSQFGCWQQSPFVKMDVSGDGFLNMTDFAVLAAEWNKTSQKQTITGTSHYYYQYLRADLDSSGKVDINDLMLFCDSYLVYYEQGFWVYDDVTSPCIDAGDPNSDWTVELWPHGKRINMGAYGGTAEASMSAVSLGNPADFDNDNDVDIDDLSLLSDVWPITEILLKEDIDRNGFVDFYDFAIFADNWLWTEIP